MATTHIRRLAPVPTHMMVRGLFHTMLLLHTATLLHRENGEISNGTNASLS